MTVYVVTAGDYDDYHIEAVFSTHEKAVEYMGGHPDKFNDIETFEVDSAPARQFVREYYHWLKGDGSDSHPKEYIVDYTEEVIAKGNGYGQTHNNLHYQSVWSETPVFMGVSYISAEHAKQLAVEERQKYLRETA